jgi:thioredoxin
MEKRPLTHKGTISKTFIMVEVLTTQSFKEKIFDYTEDKDWKYKGSKPALIDFYATWCGPCKAVAPVLEELSKEYEGKVEFYKVDTDAEQELSAAFGIRSVPSLLFIPSEGSPRMAAGALPKHAFVEAFKDIFGL